VKGPVTSWFGPRKGQPHDGIDIAARKGTPIRAAEKGKVIYSDNGISGYGNLIIIQHSGGFHTVYGHNARNLVDVDEQVNKWQVIAEVGNTGRASGYHLHFEMRKNERAVDPMGYLP
jgi:murein DD-endopeptidase MepM/ murein hydrolase activator NlpD